MRGVQSMGSEELWVLLRHCQLRWLQGAPAEMVTEVAAGAKYGTMGPRGS